MSRRQNDNQPRDFSNELIPLVDDDAFLNDLAAGVDPSEGEDELAGLLLQLREEVGQQMPPAPIIERGEVGQQMPPAPIIEGTEEESAVISLADHRQTRRPRPLVSGLIGAAAATLVIAGMGVAVFQATPGSPLWGVSDSLTGDQSSVVELASTLEEMDSRAAEGDMDGARALLDEARTLLGKMNAADRQGNHTPSTEGRRPVTATVTTTVSPTASERPEPSAEPTAIPTVTETVRETSVVRETAVATVTVTQQPAPVRPNPLPEPTQTPNPGDPSDEPGLPDVSLPTTAPPVN